MSDKTQSVPLGDTNLDTQPAPLSLTVSVPPSLRVPGYEILSELGRGGMGVVFQAKPIAANRGVAVKWSGPLR